MEEGRRPTGRPRIKWTGTAMQELSKRCDAERAMFKGWYMDWKKWKSVFEGPTFLQTWKWETEDDAGG